MQRNLNRGLSYLDYLSALMYLHRTYLVEALARYPEAPLSCKWGVSVYAVHRSALIIMVSFRRFHEQYPNAIPKVLDIWMYVSGIPALSHNFSLTRIVQSISAYVCLCAIVIRSPGCSLSPSSLLEINNTKKMFDEMNPTMMQVEKIFRAKVKYNRFLLELCLIAPDTMSSKSSISFMNKLMPLLKHIKQGYGNHTSAPLGILPTRTKEKMGIVTSFASLEPRCSSRRREASPPRRRARKPPSYSTLSQRVICIRRFLITSKLSKGTKTLAKILSEPLTQL